IAEMSIALLLTIEKEGSMAFAQLRDGWYRVVFHYGGKKYRKSLKTDKAGVADAVVGGVKRTLMMLEQGLLHIPAGADVVSFVLSGGQDVKLPSVPETVNVAAVTLEEFKSQYIDAISVGCMEPSSLNT